MLIFFWFCPPIGHFETSKSLVSFLPIASPPTGLLSLLQASASSHGGEKVLCLDLTAIGPRVALSGEQGHWLLLSQQEPSWTGLSTSHQKNTGMVPIGWKGKKIRFVFLFEGDWPRGRVSYWKWAAKLFWGQLVLCSSLHINTYMQIWRLNDSSQTYLSTHSGEKCSQYIMLTVDPSSF